jgi:predicted NAD/FAD-binding protein
MLDDALPIEREVLGAIPYKDNDVVLHTDDSLMPKRKAAWASWNYHIPAGRQDGASVTYHLNRLQGLTSERQYFVTLNCTDRIRPDSILAEFNYTHPVFGAESSAAQKLHNEINGVDRVYYCGAYWRNGFHEDGVVSALAALEHFHSRDRHAQRHFQRAS